MDPVIATYRVTVTVRGSDRTSAMPLDALVETVEQAVTEAYAEAEADAVVVNATAERTDI